MIMNVSFSKLCSVSRGTFKVLYIFLHLYMHGCVQSFILFHFLSPKGRMLHCNFFYSLEINVWNYF